MPSQTPTRKGRLFVLSGPSGAGKDLLLHELLNAPNAIPKLSRCVTATSRPPRNGEVDGVDYHFLSPTEFALRIRDGWFLEHESFLEYSYGTPAGALSEIGAGVDVILKIDVRGAQRVLEALPETILIFLAPPSLEVLRTRLEARGTETPAAIEKRLARASEEMTYATRYDYLVVNDTITQAVDAIRAIVIAERHRVGAA